jgi:carbon storage regulator
MTLVLSRRIDERILIGDVWVSVIEIQGNRVKLGIDARPEIKVLREELIDGDKQSGSLLRDNASDRVRRSSKHGS